MSHHFRRPPAAGFSRAEKLLRKLQRVARLAAAIRTQRELDELLGDADAHTRRAMLEVLAPNLLPFVPEPLYKKQAKKLLLDQTVT